MVTGDYQEEVIIFRDKQTHMHHNIYIINIMTQILCDWTDDIKATSVTTIQVETALDDH